MFNVKISKLLLATITFLSSTTGLQALQAIDNYLTELQARHNLDPQFENRRLGGYLGLMCGDMFGLALECQTRARFLKNPVEHILDTDNKHFRFRASAGAFSDDFSMALCVAEAIRSAKAQNQWANVLHFSTEFKEWAFNGKFACHETLGNNFQQLGIKANCIGVNIKAALTQGQLGKNASNGCLMRNYPVLLLADQNNLDTARYFANEHSKATHQSYLASVMLTDLCHKLLYANNPQTNKQALIEDFFNRYSRQCSDTITRYISSKVQTIINEMKTGDISQFKFYYDDPSNPNLNHHHEDEIEGHLTNK